MLVKFRIFASFKDVEIMNRNTKISYMEFIDNTVSTYDNKMHSFCDTGLFFIIY